MAVKTDLQKVYENMQLVATASAAATQVAPLMPPNIVKIDAEILKQQKMALDYAKALKAIPEMLKKIAAIVPPDYKKFRQEDPRRNPVVTSQNKPAVAKTQDPTIHKNIANIPNTTQLKPSAG